MSVESRPGIYRCDVPGCAAETVTDQKHQPPTGWRKSESPFGGRHHMGWDLCPDHGGRLRDYDRKMREWNKARKANGAKASTAFYNINQAWKDANPEPKRPTAKDFRENSE